MLDSCWGQLVCYIMAGTLQLDCLAQALIVQYDKLHSGMNVRSMPVPRAGQRVVIHLVMSLEL